MVNCRFSSEQIELLRDVLERELREIEVEVLRTDSHNFKAILKRRKAMLEALLGKVAESLATV